MSTILAVDDSATMRRCLQITFEGTEFNLVTVERAEAALERVKSLSPDLVIADVSLSPDGYELCSTIKLASPHTPVLMLSSKQNPFDPSRGAQADDHLDKPFDTQVLQDKARELIRAVPRSDTDVPGTAPGPARQPFPQERTPVPPQPRPISMPERAPSSKIPAPRRKRPTPVMITTPQQQAQAKATASAAARRTVPFAMPSPLKKTAPGTGAPIDARERTLPIPGAAEQAASANLGRNMPPRHVAPPREPPPPRESQPRAQPSPAPSASREPPPPRPSDPARVDVRAMPAAAKPLGDTLPGVPSPAGDEALGLPAPTPKSSVPAPMPAPVTPGPVAVVPAEAVAGLRQKLEALDLTKEQVEGVLALSREIVEQVVWDVVPTLAETLIREEIRRLTSE